MMQQDEDQQLHSIERRLFLLVTPDPQIELLELCCYIIVRILQWRRIKSPASGIGL